VPTLSVGDVVATTGGTLVRGDAATTVASFDIDSRALRADGAFFALPGSRTDGHRFLPDAARAGARLAVVSRDLPEGSAAPPAVVRVDDVEAALTRCGSLARERLGGVRFVAVAGSTGKTTTKELVAAALSASGTTHRTAGNRNNHLGVPLTLLACPDDAAFAAVEIGMSGAGEVAALARLVRPGVGVLTNVRPEHMEFFRTLDDVAAAEGELYAVLSDEATSVVNVDDPLARVQGLRHAGPQVTFGTVERADLRMVSIEPRFRPGTRFVFALVGVTRSVQLRLGGEHSAWNALAALAAAHAAGVDVDAAARAIAAIEPGPGRGRVHELGDGIVLVDDSYNSSPAALASILEMLRVEPGAARRVAVLGDMLEMGSDSHAYHVEAGRRAAAAGVELLVGVGAAVRATLEAARRGGVPESYLAKDADDAAGMLLERIRPGDLVVVKGSRGVALDRTVRRVLEQRAAGGGN